MKLQLLPFFLFASMASAQSSLDPLEAFKQETFSTQKQKVQSDIELCKSQPAQCKISSEFIFSKDDKSFYRSRAKTFIRQAEFKKQHPELSGDQLEQEMTRIQRETTWDFLKYKESVDEISLKMNETLPGNYKPKAYYDVVPEEYQKLIDQHYLDMQNVAKEIQTLGLSEKIESWEHKKANFNLMLNPVSNTEVLTAAPSCREEAIRQLLKLFKDDKKNILGKQFQLTAIKTALLLKKDEGYKDKELKSLEDYVNKQQQELAGDEKLKELQKMYGQNGMHEDIKRLEGITTRIKQGQYSYYHREKRLLNSDVSAFYLLMDKHEEEGVPSFGTEDAAVAWAFDRIASQMKDKNSIEYSKINLSNQVNKLMDSRVAGGSNTPVAQLEKMQASSEEEINLAIKDTLKNKLSSECLEELSLSGEEVCDDSLVDLKSAAFGQMMKDISSTAEKAHSPHLVAGYYGQVKDFLGKLSVKPGAVSKANPHSTAPKSKWPADVKKLSPAEYKWGKSLTKRLFIGAPSWETNPDYFGQDWQKEVLYGKIVDFKRAEAIKCDPKDVKCLNSKQKKIKEATFFWKHDGMNPFCLYIKPSSDGQMVFKNVSMTCPEEKKEAPKKKTAAPNFMAPQTPFSYCLVGGKSGVWTMPSAAKPQFCQTN